MVDDAPDAGRNFQQTRGGKGVTDPLTVRTTAGWVRGVYEQGPTGFMVRSWRGIPFGQDTSGAGRFLKPKPVEPWDGVRNCTEFGPVAPQSTYSWTDKIIGSEDCLNLDVVRPDVEGSLPVVVYLHGGSFFMGSSHMLLLRGFQLAASMEVVYVSVNFRLGALGYLDMRSLDGHACANPAMEDQLLALHWVRDNCRAFGGDPENVTLMGESAGGAAVLALMTSPKARGLFHKAIAQSPPIATVHSRTQSTFWCRELVSKLALPRLSTIDDVRSQDFADVVRAGQSMMWRAGELLHLNSTYAPTVDQDVLPEHPLEAFAAGHQMQIPLVLGTNADEASFGKFLFQRQFARQRAGIRLLSSYDRKGAREVVAAYNGATARADFAQLLADALFWGPAIRIADAHAQVAPTFVYRFDYAPKALRILGLGALHSLELSNIFGDPEASRMSVINRLGSTADFDELTEVMQAHWSSFMHVGRPLEQWPRYRSAYPADASYRMWPDPALDPVRDGGALENETDARTAPRLRSTMVFDSVPRVEHDPKAEKRLAWEALDMQDWGREREDLAEQLGFIVDFLE